MEEERGQNSCDKDHRKFFGQQGKFQNKPPTRKSPSGKSQKKRITKNGSLKAESKKGKGKAEHTLKQVKATGNEDGKQSFRRVKEKLNEVYQEETKEVAKGKQIGKQGKEALHGQVCQMDYLSGDTSSVGNYNEGLDYYKVQLGRPSSVKSISQAFKHN